VHGHRHETRHDERVRPGGEARSAGGDEACGDDVHVLNSRPESAHAAYGPQASHGAVCPLSRTFADARFSAPFACVKRLKRCYDFARKFERVRLCTALPDQFGESSRRYRTVATGTVKWFSNEKGYGFITPEDGGKDLFVHFSNITGEGYKSLNEGSKVEYESREGSKGPEAIDVRPIG